MLDLQSRVHLEKVEAAVLAGDEFDRAGGIVVHRPGERDRLLAHLAPRRFVEQRRRRLLDHLLVATLDRALALAEIDDMAVLVAEHLNFDVTRIDDEFLDEDAIVAERRQRFGFGAREALGDFLARVGDAHALAAAARRGLDHHRIADFVGDLGGALGALDHAEETGNGRDLGGVGELLRFDLVAHRLDGARVGADEDDPFSGERVSEGGALGEEAVAGMHRFRAGLLAGGDDLVDQKIGLRGRRRADGDRLVGHFDVQRVLVGFRIDGDRFHAHLARGLDDAAGDLAAVGDQNLVEHRRPGSESPEASPSRRS